MRRGDGEGMKAVLNRLVSEEATRMVSGSAFQRVGPATEKALSPQVLYTWSGWVVLFVMNVESSGMEWGNSQLRTFRCTGQSGGASIKVSSLKRLTSFMC